MSNIRISLGLIGLESLFGGDIRAAVEWLAVAEEIGIDGVTLTDHVVMGEALENYPYGPFPMPLDWPWWEPIALLSAIAQATKRLRLQSSILISPLRPAVLLAKQLATLDVISGGRVSIGLGVGWQKEEYDASGVPWEGRFGLMIEQIEVCRKLWSEAPAAYHGKTVSFDHIHSRPFPVQQRIPIMLGIAPSERNVARIADHADGWLPIQADVPSITEGIARLREAFTARGRDPATLMVRAVPRAVKAEQGGGFDMERTFDNARAMIEAGVTEIELFPLHFARDRAGAEKLAEQLVAFRASL